MSLQRLLEPRSIAVVGASTDPTKRGHQILRRLKESGYAGDVHAVNPAGGALLGHPLLTSVDELPYGVDLAVLCTPAERAPGLVSACGARGVGGAIVLAVGFGESGASGADLERRLRAAGREAGVRILGPNTSGLMNLGEGVNLIGASGVRAGHIALLVQSGNIALSLMNEITRRSRAGVSICCGLGNQVDVGFHEVIEHLGRHRPTRAIIAHVEGLTDARAFLRAAGQVTPHKPVVMVKSGRTAPGALGALSHTGAVAGPYDRLRAGLAQAGVVETTRTDELTDLAVTLASQPWGPPGSGIAILSDGGGQNTLAADLLTEAGAPLAVLTPATRDALAGLLGPAAAVGNPIDVAGAADRDPGVFGRAAEVLAADPGVGVLLVVGVFGGYGIRFATRHTASEVEAAGAMAGILRGAGKGLVVQAMYAAHRSAPLDILRERRAPVIESLEVACRAALELARRGRGLGMPAGGRPGFGDPRTAPGAREALPSTTAGRRRRTTPPPVEEVSVPAPIVAARGEGRLTLNELEARSLLEAAGLGFPEVRIARSVGEAERAADRIGRPVAIKLLSGTITHKSAAGGVVLGVSGAPAAGDAFRAVMANARRRASQCGLPPENYAALVSAMLPPPRAELLIGACRDPQLGPVLTLGSGGVFVEVLRDVAHRVLPVEEQQLRDMVRELRVGALLDGVRDGSGGPLEGIVAAAAAVARCLVDNSDVAEVEVNPLFAYSDRVVAVDARVILGALPTRPQTGSGAPSPLLEVPAATH